MLKAIRVEVYPSMSMSFIKCRGKFKAATVLEAREL
jgi:hypothetical protein